MLGSRQLSILAMLAVLAVGAAFWLTSSRAPSDEMTAAGPILPNLSARLNEVSEVAISAGGERVATLRKAGDGWVMPERDGYAVDVGELRELLVKLSDARRVEAKTRNPERYVALGVGDPLADASASGVRVDISVGTDSMGLIVGSNRQGGTGTYVRLVNEAQSWLTDRNIAVERRPARWLQRELTDIAASRMQSVSVDHPADANTAADRVLIEADGKSGFVLQNPPTGREAADSYDGDALAGFLADLRFVELAAADTRPMPEDGIGSAEFRSKDGIVLGLRYWVEDGQPQRLWAGFSADFDAEQAQKGIDAAQAEARAGYDAELLRFREAGKSSEAGAAASDIADAEDGSPVDAVAADELTEAPEPPLAVTDPEADHQARISAVRAEVEAIRARVDGRVFELPTFKASNLRKPLASYLKPSDD